MVHPLNELKNIRKATAELNKVKRAADSLGKILTPEEAEDLRQGIAIVEGELVSLGETVAGHDALLSRIVEYIDLPELEEPADDPAKDPEGIALVEAIVERKAEEAE